MIRKLLLALLAVVGATISAGCRREPERPPAGHPNILFVLLDDLRWDAVGYAGHPHLNTPHIDSIANEGVNFRNAFSTTSLCSPSRASLLSGMYAHKHGVTNNFTEFPSGLRQFPRGASAGGVYDGIHRQVSHG